MHIAHVCPMAQGGCTREQGAERPKQGVRPMKKASNLCISCVCGHRLCGKDMGRIYLWYPILEKTTDRLSHGARDKVTHVFVLWLGVAAPESREQSDRNEGCGQEIKPQICV
jgi:hypothetical protein